MENEIEKKNDKKYKNTNIESINIEMIDEIKSDLDVKIIEQDSNKKRINPYKFNEFKSMKINNLGKNNPIESKSDSENSSKSFKKANAIIKSKNLTRRNTRKISHFKDASID